MRVWSTAIYKSIVLLSLIICLRKGYAFEHLEQFTCTPYYVERYEKLEVVIPSEHLDRLPPVQMFRWNTLIKEIIIDKKKLHLYNEYTEVSYES